MNKCMSSVCLDVPVLLKNVLQMGFGRGFTDAKHLSRLLDAKSWCHCKEHA